MHFTSQALNPGSILDFRKLGKTQPPRDWHGKQNRQISEILVFCSSALRLACGNLADPPKLLPLDFLTSHSEDFHWWKEIHGFFSICRTILFWHYCLCQTLRCKSPSSKPERFQGRTLLIMSQSTETKNIHLFWISRVFGTFHFTKAASV